MEEVTIRQSEIREREREWRKAGLVPCSFATFKDNGARGEMMVRVKLVKEDAE